MDQKTYDHYPENMRLSTDEMEHVQEMIAVGANKKKIKADLMRKTGRPIMMKQLHNIQTKMQSVAHDGPGSDLQKLFDMLEAIPDVNARFVSNENGEFVGITTAQRHQALEVLQRLVYAESRHSYNQIYKELCDLNLEHVTRYFDDNWGNITDEWTCFGRNQYAHFMSSTNNRSERLNRTIKDIGNRNSNLLVFFENLSTTVSTLASEKDIKAIRSTMKVERKRFEHPVLERRATLYKEKLFFRLSVN